MSAPDVASGLFVRDEGAGPPVVLVHAGVADGRMWQPQIDALSGRYRLIVPDLRGFGRTPTLAHSFSHAEDLHGIATRLGIGPATWVGCSMGGTAVLDLALTRPDTMSGLVLVDCVPSGQKITDPITRAGWEAADEAFAAGDPRKAAEIEMEMWLVGPARANDDVPRHLQELVTAMVLDSYEHADAEEIDPAQPAIDQLSDIAVPTLVVVGEYDQLPFRQAASLLAEQIPGATLEIVKDAAHLPSLEQPQQFNALLTGFLPSAL